MDKEQKRQNTISGLLAAIRSGDSSTYIAYLYMGHKPMTWERAVKLTNKVRFNRRKET